MVNEMIATWNEAFGNYFNMEPVSQSELEQKEFPAETILLRYVLYDLPVTPPVSLLSLFQSDSHNNPAKFKKQYI